MMYAQALRILDAYRMYGRREEADRLANSIAQFEDDPSRWPELKAVVDELRTFDVTVELVTD